VLGGRRGGKKNVKKEMGCFFWIGKATKNYDSLIDLTRGGEDDWEGSRERPAGEGQKLECLKSSA